MTDNCGKVLEFFEALINERLEMRKNKNGVQGEHDDILEILLNDSQQKHEELNLSLIKSLCLDLFVAGTDTIASTLEWAMTEVLANPHIMAKAKDEFSQVIGKGKIHDENDVLRLPYLQNIVKETLRIHAPVPLMLPRKLQSQIELNGSLPISLDLSSNSLCSNGVKETQALNLGNNSLSGVIPECWEMYVAKAAILELGKQQFFWRDPKNFGRFFNLVEMSLLEEFHHGNILRCFHNFTVLSVKENISTDEFSLYIVYCWATIASDLLVTKGREDTYSTILQFVMLLDLSSNNLTGHIPSELTTLVKLNSLNLSRNQLTRRIPKKIGSLKSLESFDVSLNKLYGELPMSLTGLNSLSSFNLSYYNLTGRVPSSTQLQILNKSSFFGNNLCGAPLTKHCAVKVSDMKDQDQDHGSHGTDWGLIASTVFGLIAGFWIVITP
ncbi:putative leucine-rich repeat protein [Tanacetum coccineum]